jgi:hypothetical protein
MAVNAGVPVTHHPVVDICEVGLRICLLVRWDEVRIIA